MLCVYFQVFDQIKAIVESVFQVLYFSMAYMVYILYFFFLGHPKRILNSPFSIINQHA